MNRRGFLGKTIATLAGLLGLSSASKAAGEYRIRPMYPVGFEDCHLTEQTEINLYGRPRTTIIKEGRMLFVGKLQKGQIDFLEKMMTPKDGFVRVYSQYKIIGKNKLSFRFVEEEKTKPSWAS